MSEIGKSLGTIGMVFGPKRRELVLVAEASEDRVFYLGLVNKGPKEVKSW